MTEETLRVITVAVKKLPSDIKEYTENNLESNLVFLGLVGIIDPPRKEVFQSIKVCKQAGIKTVMITGDHKLTARAIARELGNLSDDSQVLTESKIDSTDDKTFNEKVSITTVYARVATRHKLRIVKALKRARHVVAMTGDGINDAPAVKEADIGISMGKTGIDVTKEASSIILVDDNFKFIVSAIKEGRNIYDNIRKFIRYLLSCNVGEVLVMLLAVFMVWPLPLIAVQILWMNLVTDGFPAMALGLEKTDKDIMKRPPRAVGESIWAKRYFIFELNMLKLLETFYDREA